MPHVLSGKCVKSTGLNIVALVKIKIKIKEKNATRVRLSFGDWLAAKPPYIRFSKSACFDIEDRNALVQAYDSAADAALGFLLQLLRALVPPSYFKLETREWRSRKLIHFIEERAHLCRGGGGGCDAHEAVAQSRASVPPGRTLGSPIARPSTPPGHTPPALPGLAAAALLRIRSTQKFS